MLLANRLTETGGMRSYWVTEQTVVYFSKIEPFLCQGYRAIFASFYAGVIWLLACKRAASGKQAEGREPECVWISTSERNLLCTCLNSVVGKRTITPVRLPRHTFITVLIHRFMYFDNNTNFFFLVLNNDFMSPTANRSELNKRIKERASEQGTALLIS